MGKLMLEKIKRLEEIGEDTIFDRMVEGHTVKSIVGDLQIGWRTFYKWVDNVEANDFRANVQLHIDFVLSVEVGSGKVGDCMFGLN